MSHSLTPDGNLNVYDDNDNPGAGSKTVGAHSGNLGLNGNPVTIGGALFGEHNTDGTHKNDKIHGANLHSDSLDGVTLEFSAASGTKAGRIKSVPINKIDLTGAAEGEVLMKSGGVADWNLPIIGTAQITAASVTGVKISHDNNRTKSYLLFAQNVSGAASIYFDSNGQTLSAVLGVPMLRAGAITGYAITQSDGSVVSNPNLYSSSADNHFVAGDRLAFRFNKTPAQCVAVKNGTDVTNIGPLAVTTFGATIAIVEFEFD